MHLRKYVKNHQKPSKNVTNTSKTVKNYQENSENGQKRLKTV